MTIILEKAGTKADGVGVGGRFAPEGKRPPAAGGPLAPAAAPRTGPFTRDGRNQAGDTVSERRRPNLKYTVRAISWEEGMFIESPAGRARTVGADGKRRYLGGGRPSTLADWQNDTTGEGAFHAPADPRGFHGHHRRAADAPAPARPRLGADTADGLWRLEKLDFDDIADAAALDSAATAAEREFLAEMRADCDLDGPPAGMDASEFRRAMDPRWAAAEDNGWTGRPGSI